MSTPLISIIVPVYNVSRYIERCARSLFEQSLNDIEYIFVDDCSPDNSIEILHQILSDYPSRMAQVKIISHEKNRGVAAARNTGLKLASGEFIAQCDSGHVRTHAFGSKAYIGRSCCMRFHYGIRDIFSGMQ